MLTAMMFSIPRIVFARVSVWRVSFSTFSLDGGEGGKLKAHVPSTRTRLSDWKFSSFNSNFPGKYSTPK